jgi:GH25 family lysozyme M1 (1,4-beta-N-acetylmuramidase)
MSRKGIDVSKWQGVIDWNKVKAAGIEFAMIRSSFGKENKAKQTDAQFHANMTGAKAAGILCGAYHYSYATTVEEAKQEAAFFLDIIKGYSFDFPVAFDIEDKSQRDLGRDRITDIIVAFCDTVEKAGYYVSVYTNLDWLKNRIDVDRVKRFDIWLAQWTDKPTYGGDFGMWQYTSDGSVAGIGGRVDMDIAYKDYAALIKNAGLNNKKGQASAPAPTPTPAPAAPAPALAHSVGEHVVFSTCYASSTDGTEKAIPESKMLRNHGTITKTYPGRHNPYLLDNGLCFVNDGDIRGPYSAATPVPAPAPKMRVGATVKYSGTLYSDSYGEGPGKSVNGTYTVTRYIAGRKCGVLLGQIGWVPESACRVVG